MCSLKIFRYSITMLLVLFELREVICRSLRTDDGPFEVVIQNTTSCISKEPAWFKTNITTFTSHGQSLLRGTVTVKRELKNVKFRIQLFFTSPLKLKAFDIKNQNCQNPVVQQVLDMIRVPFNRQKCTMNPNYSEFNNLNLNTIVHSVVKTMWYGNVTIRWEIAIATTQLMCLNIDLQVVKIKDIKNKTAR